MALCQKFKTMWHSDQEEENWLVWILIFYIYIYIERERERERGNVTFRLVLKQTLGILIGCNLKTQVDINVYLYCISCQTFVGGE